MDAFVVQFALWFGYGLAALRLDPKLPLPFAIGGPLMFMVLAAERISKDTLPSWAGWALGVLIILLASVEV